MKTLKSDRGFIFLYHPSNLERKDVILASESSAVGDYEDSFDNPGSSFLWIGSDHHLNRTEVKEFVNNLQHWLDTGRLLFDPMEAFDQTQANEEGWCISQCSGSQYFPEDWFDIQCWAESDRFENDLQALTFVINKVNERSEYHMNALTAMESTNFSMVREYQKNEFNNQNSV